MVASKLSDNATATPPQGITLDTMHFDHICSLEPQRDAMGSVVELWPQARYKKADKILLHKYGQGAFCKFRIRTAKGVTGVYLLVKGREIVYIGECADLAKRFNGGYGCISPRKCYIGGQLTNCKINRYIFDVTKDNGNIDLYFCVMTSRKAVEKQLIGLYSPPWND